jgi:cytochrome P450
MGVAYDPFADEAMVDPRPLYARMRAEGPVHRVEQYDAWALAGFGAVWQVCKDTENFTCTNGVPPGSALLGEPVGISFTALDPPLHRLRRRIVASRYTREAADRDEPVIRTLTREVLGPLVATGHGEMDVYGDFAGRVAARVAGYKAGVPADDAEWIRNRCADAFTREPGQRGTSAENVAALTESHAYLQDLVASARRDPEDVRGDLASLIAGTIDGRPLSDEEVTGDLFTVLITGSETTETAVSATVYYLAQHPEQLAAVRADHALIPHAFVETIRYDHPTDLLCRDTKHEVDVAGTTLRPGQPVILLWGSVGLDETEHPHADRFDIHRRPPRSLSFGHGQHKCIGEHLAVRMGTVMLEEFFSAVAAYEVDVDRCQRKYAEFVKGFNAVPIRFTTDGAAGPTAG